MPIQMILLRAVGLTTTGGIASWTAGASWKLAWMPRNKPRFSDSDMVIGDPLRVSETLLWFPSACSSPVLTIRAYGL
jgi:hypothetical protein